jgi:hypothetical protein
VFSLAQVVGDEILTMVPGRRRPPDQPLQDWPGARGLCPLGTLARALQQEDPTEFDSTTASSWGSGALLSLGLPIYGISGPSA